MWAAIHRLLISNRQVAAVPTQHRVHRVLKAHEPFDRLLLRKEQQGYRSLSCQGRETAYSNDASTSENLSAIGGVMSQCLQKLKDVTIEVLSTVYWPNRN